MTLLERFKVRIPEADRPDDAVLEDALESAKSIYLNLRYPVGDYPTIFVPDDNGDPVEVPVVEPRYMDWVLRAAMELWAKAGAEGEIAHTENGVSRSYDSAWLSAGLVREVVPYVGVVG